LLTQTLLRIGLWTSLGAWVGSWGFFAFVVSRIAFRVLPGDVAGDLAGSLLTVLHWGGASAALVAAGCTFGLGRRGGLLLLPMGLALICVLSELWISPEVALVRPSTLGEASSAFSANRFRLLHRLSLGLFMAVHFASIGLLVWHARQDARERNTPASASARP
jgi:hypothetical protein